MSTLNSLTLARMFLPMAISWAFMACEQPALNRILNGFPEPELAKAALFLLMALALFIESPVIDLLGTSTALGRSRASLAAIFKFTGVCMITVTVVHGAVAFTPLYDLIAFRLLNQDPAVAEAARTPFQIMSVWSAFVGWRRCRQGLMIRAGNTKPIGTGTFLRIIILVAVAAGFPSLFGMPSLHAVAWALVASVIAEAVYAHIVSQPAVATLRARESEPGETNTLLGVFKFHLPLTVTTVVVMSSSPLLAFALARAKDPVLTQSAWAVASALIWFFRSPSYALPELVIARGDEPNSDAPIQRFCIQVGLLLSGVMLLIAVTPLNGLVFTGFMSSPPLEANLAQQAFLICAYLPLLNCLMSLERGRLTRQRATLARLYGIATGMVALLSGLFIGISAGWSGIYVACFAISVGQIAEYICLLLLRRALDRRNALAPAQ